MGSYCWTSPPPEVEIKTSAPKQEPSKGKTVPPDEENKKKEKEDRLNYQYDVEVKKFEKTYTDELGKVRLNPSMFAAKIEERMRTELFKQGKVQSKGKKTYSVTNVDDWNRAIAALRSHQGVDKLYSNQKYKFEIPNNISYLNDEVKLRNEALKTKKFDYVIQGDCEDVETLLIMQMVDDKKRENLLDEKMNYLGVTTRTFGDNDFCACICLAKKNE